MDSWHHACLRTWGNTDVLGGVYCALGRVVRLSVCGDRDCQVHTAWYLDGLVVKVDSEPLMSYNVHSDEKHYL